MASTTVPVLPSLDLGQDTFYGLYATQGTRKLITINLPLIDVPDYVHRPNPDIPTPGNRRVKNASCTPPAVETRVASIARIG